jgi:hypothetical protein
MIIPTFSSLQKQVSQTHIDYCLSNKPTYFAIADEYVELQTKFLKDTFLSEITLWMDMIFYPLYTLISVLFFGSDVTVFTGLTIQKTIQHWKDWFRYKELSAKLREWTSIARSIGGPFISTNDPTYHVYVYADAMTRLHTAVTLSKKCAKRL